MDNENDKQAINDLLQKLGLKEVEEIYKLLNTLNKKELDYNRMLTECADLNKKTKINNYINKVISAKKLLKKQMNSVNLPEDLNGFESALKILSQQEIDNLHERAKNKDVDALFELGNLYREGLSVDLNNEKAIKFYKKASSLGHEKASIVLDNIGEKRGLNIPIKYKKAIYLSLVCIPILFIVYLLTYDNRTPEELNLIAYNYFIQDNYEKSIKYYEKSINKGDFTILSIVGDMYFYGNENFTPDFDTALEVYTISSNNNDDINQSYSQYQIANMYYNGIGVEADFDKALYYYELSANNDFIKSAKIVGDIYYNGDEVFKDSSKALYYYLKCSSSPEMSEVQYYIGNIYFAGSGALQDYEQALNWYKKASINGVVEASYLTGYMYEYGIGGINKDYASAIKYYSKATEEGHIQAMYNLASVYSNESYYISSNQEKLLNYELAFDMYKQAADLGHLESMYKVSNMYSEGLGVVRHSLKSEEYLELAKSTELKLD